VLIVAKVPSGGRRYPALDRVVCFVARAGSARFVLLKLALEVMAFHPLGLVLFFGGMGTLNGNSAETVKETLRRDFWPTLWFEVALWCPLDVAMFRFVPVRFQLLVVNCGGFVESIALSWVNANGVPVIAAD